MSFQDLWQNEKVVLAVVTAVLTLMVTLLGQKILPGLWKALANLWKRLAGKVGRRRAGKAFERRYLDWLCETRRYLPVRGIRTHTPVQVELEQVYVSLSLRNPARRGPGEGRRPGEPAELELLGHTPLERLRAQGERLPSRLSVGQALSYGSRTNRIVILGGPGTGKTTLVSYLALVYARDQAKGKLDLDEKRLPIVIPLRDLLRSKQSLEARCLPALCAPPDLARECTPEFFERRLKDGTCIVLLDGMDEVTSDDERRRVAQEIERLIACYPDGNRYVVTSRPAGYSSAPLSGFAEFTILDFEDEDVEQFARHWCLAVEYATRDTREAYARAIARSAAEREAERLLAAIRASDRVRQLTINPLLLTIVAMAHRYRATLPSRRVELYKECTEVLLGYWDQAKGIAGQMDWERKRRALEPLAYRMHAQGRTEAEAGWVRDALAEALPYVGERADRAGEFLRGIRERSGLLVERGPGSYAFSHLTFQEYLAACHLVDRGEAGREELLAHLHEPWWLEVTLLYAGLQDATPLIEAILAPEDDLFRSNLFLAARCLVDVVNLDEGTQDQVLSELLDECLSSEYEGLHDRAREALAALRESSSSSKIIDALLERLDNEHVDVHVHNAYDALGQLGWAGSAVEDAMLARLDAENVHVRVHAVYTLGRLGQAEPRIVDALVRCLGDENADVRMLAAYALGQLGRAESTVVDAIVKCLVDENAHVRGNAVEALGQLGQAEPRVVDALIEHLGDEQANVREGAAFALGQLGQAELWIVDLLLDHLSDEDLDVLAFVILALFLVGQTESRGVDALVDCLGNERAVVRGGAAYALGQLGQADAVVVDALLGLLGDEKADVRSCAAAALGQLGQGNERVVDGLLGLLGGELLGLLRDEQADVRGIAAEALGQLGQAEPRVVDALLALLADPEADVRSRAAAALGQLGQTEPRVVDALLGLLGDEKADVRESAAAALGQLGQTEPRVVDALLALLADPEADARGSAASALVSRWRGPDATPLPLPAARVPALVALLDDERELEYPLGGKVGRIKDLAWQLLSEYSAQSGERIARPRKGEAK